MTIKVYNGDVDKDAIQRLYASKLQQTFGKFARALSMRDVKVSLQMYNSAFHPAPAWSTDDGLVVTYDPAHGSVLSANNLLRLKGLLIHELSHILYTPRSLSTLSKWVSQNAYNSTFNILEDNRIENMMVVKMSGIKPWLVHTITSELLGQTYQDVLPLVWGRKYLEPNVRALASKAWAKRYGSEHADEVCKYVDEYIQLNLGDNKTHDRAKVLIAELHSLLHPTTAQNSRHGNQASSPVSNGEKAESKSEQGKLLNQVDMSEPELDSDEGSGQTPTQALESALQGAADDAFNEVLQDVKNTISNIRGDESGGEVHNDAYTPKQGGITDMPKWCLDNQVPSTVSIQASRRFANELVNLKAEHDPGWLRKTSQGRVNVRQFMEGADFDEMFDEWSEGNQDVSDIECVILVDNSGSMYDMVTPAYEATWTIKRALDSIDASTTVIQFADRGGWLYKADERATAQMRTANNGVGGSTYPFSSLKAAKDILLNSPRAIKILLVVTDGQWGQAQGCDQLITVMRTAGVITSLVFLSEPIEKLHPWNLNSDGSLNVDAHKCEFAHHLTDPLQIVDVAKAITKRAQRALLV